jgi:hypothetical protein
MYDNYKSKNHEQRDLLQTKISKNDFSEIRMNFILKKNQRKEKYMYSERKSF